MLFDMSLSDRLKHFYQSRVLRYQQPPFAQLYVDHFELPIYRPVVLLTQPRTHRHASTEKLLRHIDETAQLINQLDLEYLSTLQIGLDPVIEKEFYGAFASTRGRDFEWQDDTCMLIEQKCVPLIFRSKI